MANMRSATSNHLHSTGDVVCDVKESRIAASGVFPAGQSYQEFAASRSFYNRTVALPLRVIAALDKRVLRSFNGGGGCKGPLALDCRERHPDRASGGYSILMDVEYGAVTFACNDDDADFATSFSSQCGDQ